MKKTSAKLIAVVVVVALLIGGAIGGTIAWLSAKTESITNTFTVGNIDITLDEGDNLDLKMVPGDKIAKDPVVTVKGGSEACWLFVEVTEENNLDTFITYAARNGWTAVPDVENVYYMEVDENQADQKFYFLSQGDGEYANGYVTVNGEVTKGQMDTLTDETLPKLTFTAYAVQMSNVDTVADAWAIAKPANP